MATNINAAAIASKKLSRFIEACMDPLPDASLLDTHYNSIVRQQRRDAWRQADNKTRYYKALWEAATCTEMGISYRVDPVATVPSMKECLKLYRQAIAEQLLTPVERKANVAWKRRQDPAYLPVTAERVEKAIAEDERFLAMHPTARRGRGSGRETV